MSNYDTYESGVVNFDVLTQHVPQGTKGIGKIRRSRCYRTKIQTGVSHIKNTQFTFHLTSSIFRHIFNLAPLSQKLFHK
jgi:hypothetical protein